VQSPHPRGEAGRGRNPQHGQAFASGGKRSTAGSRFNGDALIRRQNRKAHFPFEDGALARVLAAVERLHAEHGVWWDPAPLLRRLGREGRSFAQWARERG
jgi:hypothetical protein